MMFSFKDLFLMKYDDARMEFTLAKTEADARADTMAFTVFGAIAGLIAATFQLGMPGDEGVAGEKHSAKKSEAYVQQATEVVQEEARLKNMRQAIHLITTEGLQPPAVVREMEAQYTARYESLQRNFQDVSYQVMKDQDIGEKDTAAVLNVLKKTSSDLKPKWIEDVQYQGIQECRPKFASVAADRFGESVAGCTEGQVSKQFVTTVAYGTGAGLAFGLGVFFGIPAARGGRVAYGLYKHNKAHEKKTALAKTM